MKFKELKCSNCGASDFSMLNPGTFYCNYCGTKILVEEEKQPRYDPVSHHVTINVPAKKFPKFVVFSVLGALVSATAGIVVFLISPTTAAAEPDNKVQNEADKQNIQIIPTIRINGMDVPDTLSARLHNPDVRINDLEIVEMPTSEGSYQYRVTGIYENRAGALIRMPRIEMDLYDHNVKLQSLYPRIARNYLIPGEKCLFSGVITLKQPYSHYEIRTPTNNFGPFRERLNISITDAGFTSDKPRPDHSQIFSMQVENMSEHSASVEVIITFFDETKKTAGFHKTTVYPRLSPGEKIIYTTKIRPFSANMFDRFSGLYGKPVSWSIDYNTY